MVNDAVSYFHVMRFMIHLPHEAEELETVRRLFREYAETLNLDLSAQSYAQELCEAPGSRLFS